MAVQQNKKSPSRRGMRRSQQTMSALSIVTEKKSGDRHLRHHISPSGYYRGKQIVLLDTDSESVDQQEE